MLIGHSNDGLRAAFDPAGALLASNDFDDRLWLWDPILGRSWLNLTGSPVSEFSADGRIAVSRSGELVTYQLEPALEYRSFVHAANPPLSYSARPSIRTDGRLLVMGTDGGVLLWDLARWTELAFLPIGLAWSTRFEPSGDLLTSGDLGVWRWPVTLDTDRNELRVGPPARLPLPASHGGIDEDRSGRVVALAGHTYAYVLTPERSFKVGPLDDCRGVSLSPDGQWLATNSFAASGVRVWRIQDGKEVPDLQIVEPGDAVFSPDGNWLAGPNGRRWEVGTWREGQKGGGSGHCFSPDGRMVVVTDADKVQRLIEADTGRTLARLESPDQSGVWGATFSPDGTRLVLATNDGPAVHVWNLRAIRRKLAKMKLDWDAPSYPDIDRTAEDILPAALKVLVDAGPIKVAAEAQSLLEEAMHLEESGKIGDAIELLRRAPGRFRSTQWSTTTWRGCSRLVPSHCATRPRPWNTPAVPSRWTQPSDSGSTLWALPSTARANLRKPWRLSKRAWSPEKARSKRSTSSFWRWRNIGQAASTKPVRRWIEPIAGSKTNCKVCHRSTSRSWPPFALRPRQSWLAPRASCPPMFSRSHDREPMPRRPQLTAGR